MHCATSRLHLKLADVTVNLPYFAAMFRASVNSSILHARWRNDDWFHGLVSHLRRSTASIILDNLPIDGTGVVPCVNRLFRCHIALNQVALEIVSICLSGM